MKKIYKLNRFLLMTGLVVLSLNAFGQTGPAGIGNATGANGQPENLIWFDAARLNLNNSEAVEHLTDFSGKENHAEQSIVGARPQFLTNQINGKPAISFDGSDDFMPFNGNVIVSSDYTVLFVGKRRSNNSFRALFGGTSTSTNTNLHVYWYNDTQLRSHHYSNDLQTDMVDAVESFSGGREVNTYGIFSTSLNSSLASAQRKNFQNNQLLGSRNSSAQLTSWEGAAIGRYRTGFHDVDVAEFIVFKSALSTAQMQIASQYLALKYGIAIDNDIFSAPVGYDVNMAGIGKEADGIHSLASVSGLYLQENGSFDNGDYLFVSESDVINDSPVTSDLPLGVEERWKKDFSIRKVGSFNASLIFDLSEGIVNGHYPSDIDNYVLLYRAGTSGDYSVVSGAVVEFGSNTQVKFNVADTDLQEGYYTLGTTDQFASPVIGKDGVTWYTLVSGNWNDPQIWTLDPAGMLPNNPSNSYPQQASDNIVIRNGRTVTVQSNGLIGSRLTIDGRLDLGTTNGHQFSEIRGNGRVLMAADNFPDGDASHFSGRGKGEGTVQFYGGSYDIAISREFFNVEIGLNSTEETVTLLNNLTVQGYLKIDRGGLRINNDVSTSVLDVNIQGNVYVEANGRITTGEGNTKGIYSIGGTMPETGEYHNIFHQFRIGGDFINRGSVRLTNLTAPVFNQFADNGAVTLRFYGGANNIMQLYGVTDIYNLVVEKGIDRTYTLEVYSDDAAYFTLFGPNSAGRVTNGAFSAANPEVRKALWIRSGTLKLTGQINIPTLSEGSSSGGNGDYAIGQNAALWIAGAGVSIYSTASEQNQITGHELTAVGVDTGGSNQAMSLYGSFRISDGFFGTRNSAGFIFWSESYAQVRVEGGTVDVSQFRSGAVGGGKTSYTQTGGILVVRGSVTEAGEKSGSYAIFGFDSENAVFNMSGGNILLHDTGGSDVNGLYIPSLTGNYNVTGGSIIIDIPGNRTFEIASNANLWNLEIKRYDASGTSTVLLKQDLKVGRDLIINDNTLFEVQDGTDYYDLYVGRNFDLKTSGQYHAGENTTHFYSNQSGVIYARDNSLAAPLKFHDVIINKDQAWDPTVFRAVSLGSTGRTTDPTVVNNTAIEIQGDLTITRGEFNTFRYKVAHKGSIEIVDGRILANATNPGRIVLNGAAEQTIKGALTQQQSFGSIELINPSGAKLLSSIEVSDFYMHTGLMNLDTYNLRVTGTVAATDGVFGADRMFVTAGNAGGGGLSRYLDLSQGIAESEHLFPIGTSSGYSPLLINQSATLNDAGTITVKAINDYHPTLVSGNANQTVPYYWIVKADGFPTLVKENLKYTFFSPVNAAASANRGAWLNYEDYTWSTLNNIVLNRNRINFPYSVELEGEYTIGNNSTFKDPTIYYSTLMNNNNSTDFGTRDKWHNASKWSTVGHYSSTNTGTYPQQGDIAILGFGLESATATTDNSQRSHWFFVDQNVDVAILIFANEVVNADGISVPRNASFLPQLVVNNNSALDVNFAVVKGEGTFNVRVGCTTCNADPEISNAVTANITADFNDFANNLNSRFDYELYTSNESAVYLPSIFPDVYPNVHVKGQNGTNRVLIFQEDILIKRDLTLREGATLRLNHGEFGDIEVYRNIDFTINDRADVLEFPDTGYERTLTVHGDIVMDDNNNDVIRVLNSTPSNLVHTLRLGGNIQQGGNSSIDLFTNNSGGNNVILSLIGEVSAEYNRISGTQPSLYRVVLNKQSNRSFTFNNSFTLNGPTDGEIKALELVGGTLNLWDSGIDITLTSGGSDFRIPAGTGLYLGSSATVRVTGDNTGIWLDGTITGGYNTNFFLNGGANNYIEYTSSGNSRIILHQANFYVGSQIRRSESAEEGILNFRQNHVNSIVKIGTNAHLGGLTNRGVFEMVTPGSYFYQAAGARMSIVNAVPNSTVPSLNINLTSDAVDLRDGSIIAFGDAETVADQSFGLFSSVNLKDVRVDNGSGNNPIVNMNVVSASIDNLTIDAGATWLANGLDLIISGDWNNAGNYVSGLNTTTFTGLVDQNVSGNTIFHNLVKSGGSDFILDNANADIVVDNSFVFDAGQLHGNDNEVFVSGDLSFNGQYLHSGTSKGIVMGGTETQKLIGNGVFGMLTVSNLNGVDVPVGNQLTVNDRLRLEQGVLNIGSNLFILGVDSEIEAGNPFSVSNMIQTNISFTDNGVKKFIPSGAFSFVFPMGSAGKYTPVSFDISNNTNVSGSLLVKPAGEYHPSVIDPDNVLHYHWVLRAEGLSDFNGTARMRYYPVDLKPDPDIVSVYITARLLSDGSGEWNKFSNDDIDILNNQLIFNFNDANDDGISGDYTAGVDGAIPDQVPAYISKTSGSWNLTSTWDTYPEAGGSVPAGGPRGSMVIVAHSVDVPANYISSYRTTIQESGRLDLGTTFGHRLGDVLGNGILSIDRGDLPAGVYDEFFSANGGTLDFKGSSDYDILSDITQVNHLKVTGLGARRLPNLSLQLLGNLTIDGVSLQNEHYQTLSVMGDINFISGSFNAGFGSNSKVVFNGTQSQTVSGIQSFTGVNKFHRLNVNNSAGVLVTTDIDVAEVLTLTNGRLVVNDGTVFSILNPATDAISGASATRYIDGPLYKRINSGTSFDFPLGNEGRYGNIALGAVSASGMWRAQYHSSSPSGAGLSTSSKEAPVQYVSSGEYWNIEAPVAATADVTLRWDASSGVNPAESGLRGVQWLTDKWYEVTLTDVTGTSSAGTAKTSSVLNFNANAGGNYLTFGAITIPAYTWTGATDTDWFKPGNWTNSTVPSASANTTIALTGNMPVIAGANVAQVNNLIIDAGVDLTVASNGKLTVNGDLNIAATGELVLDNAYGLNGMSSLITHGQILGTGSTRIRLTTPSNQWFYLGSSIKDAVFSDFSAGEPDIIINIYRANKWWGIKSGLAHRSLRSMEGIVTNLLLDGAPDRLIEYTGELHTAAVSRLYDESGYHLLANPYPSFISWEEAAGWDRPNVSGTIWYRGKINEEMAFITYNRDALPNAKVALYPDTEVTFTTEEELALIPPMQAVWVSTAVPGVTVTVKPEARRHGIDGSRLKSSSSSRYGDVIRIETGNEFSRDGAVLYFSNDSEEALDKGDSEKYFNDSENIPEIYTRVGEKALSINGLPLLNEAARTIPLSVRNRIAGEVTMKFDLSYYYGQHTPYLEDKETGTFINLLHENSYTYTVSETGDNHDRFVLNFYLVSTNLETPGADETDAGSAIKIKSLSGKVLVSMSPELAQSGNAMVEVYTIDGRKVDTLPVLSSRTLLFLPDEKGVYIIRAVANKAVKSERVIYSGK
jgi:hypothetical protein